jgi:hypothetical protein
VVPLERIESLLQGAWSGRHPERDGLGSKQRLLDRSWADGAAHSPASH